MKYYYVIHPNHFGNVFDLCWIDSSNAEGIKELEHIGWDRISRKKAFDYVSEEKRRRKYDPSFAYFGSTTILPHYIFTEVFDIAGESDGCIVFDSAYTTNGKRVRKVLKTKDGVIYE